MDDTPKSKRIPSTGSFKFLRILEKLPYFIKTLLFHGKRVFSAIAIASGS
jgi:hypothetical protein